jgi:hypothetical protein
MERDIESSRLSTLYLIAMGCAHGYVRSPCPGDGPTLDDFELLRRDLHGCSLVDVQVRL